MEILDEVIFPYQGGRQAQAAVRLDGGGHRSSRLNSEKMGYHGFFIDFYGRFMGDLWYICGLSTQFCDLLPTNHWSIIAFYITF